MLTNCVNCGAPLRSAKCEYCGTQYHNNKVYAEFDAQNVIGELNIAGKVYKVYLANVIVDRQDMVYRDEHNRLAHSPVCHRKFTLVEY